MDREISVVSGVQQVIKAEAYRGRRMRWTAHLLTEDLSSVWKNDSIGATRTAATRDNSPRAGVYLFIDSRDAILKYVMTRDRLLGTNDWTMVETVFDVPTDGVVITVGFFLAAVTGSSGVASFVRARDCANPGWHWTNVIQQPSAK
jgi:hypothetical protein